MGVDRGVCLSFQTERVHFIIHVQCSQGSQQVREEMEMGALGGPPAHDDELGGAQGPTGIMRRGETLHSRISYVSCRQKDYTVNSTRASR